MPLGNIFGTAQAGSDAAAGENKALGFLNQIRGDVAPAWKTGLNTYQMLSDPNKLMSNFYTSPDYQFRLSQGINAVNTDKAANGLLRSGGALKAVTQYGSDLASQEFGDYFNRQKSLADFGLSAEGIAAGVADKQAGVAQQGGQDQANLDLAQGNNISNVLGSVFSSYG